MSESLASGLTTRFFDESSVSRAALQRQFSDSKLLARSWQKTLRSVHEALNPLLLCAYIGGSKRHPYYVADVLDVVDRREYNTWNERCLTAVTCFLGDGPRYCGWIPSCYSISEHAVRRMFLRTVPVVDGKTIQTSSIFKELGQLALWSNFWMNALAGAGDLHQHCHPIVPTRAGVLFGEFNKATKTLEIRTFVDESRLVTEQAISRTVLDSLSQDLNPSPACFALASAWFGVDDSYFVHSCLAFRLLTHPEFQAVLNTAFFRVESPSERESAKRRFEVQLRNQAAPAAGGADDLLRKLGLSRFQHVAREARVPTSRTEILTAFKNSGISESSD